MEQRYDAVMEVLKEGRTVVEVAARYGVSRQSVHNWITRYQEEGIEALANRSSRPRGCPTRCPPRSRPGWCRCASLTRAGARRPSPFSFARAGVDAVPSASGIKRALGHRGPVSRPKEEKEEGVPALGKGPGDGALADGRGRRDPLEGRHRAKGRDGGGRPRATASPPARPTSDLESRLRRTATGPRTPRDPRRAAHRQREGLHRPHRPAPVEVLFDRICRENGIRHLLTAVRSPTTTGKVERFHRTLRDDFLAEASLTDIDQAQEALDLWVEEYNTWRPHQSLDMATPAERFATATPSTPSSRSRTNSSTPDITSSGPRSSASHPQGERHGEDLGVLPVLLGRRLLGRTRGRRHEGAHPRCVAQRKAHQDRPSDEQGGRLDQTSAEALNKPTASRRCQPRVKQVLTPFCEAGTGLAQRSRRTFQTDLDRDLDTGDDRSTTDAASAVEETGAVDDQRGRSRREERVDFSGAR